MQVEAQFSPGIQFVDVLAAGARAAVKREAQLGEWDVQAGSNLDCAHG